MSDESAIGDPAGDQVRVAGELQEKNDVSTSPTMLREGKSSNLRQQVARGPGFCKIARRRSSCCLSDSSYNGHRPTHRRAEGASARSPRLDEGSAEPAHPTISQPLRLKHVPGVRLQLAGPQDA